MPVAHKTHIMNRLKFPLKGAFHASRQGNFNFEIFKKSVDIGKDLIRTHVQWMSRFNRVLPLVGLIIGLTSFTLQTLILVFDRNRSLPTKIAATFIFLSMTALAIGAFILAESAPMIATGLALAISTLNFSVDIFKFATNLRQYKENKIALSHLNNEKMQKAKQDSKEQLLAEQSQLNADLKQKLNALLIASQQTDEKLHNKLLKQVHITLISLVKKNERIQAICSPQIPLEREISKQSYELTIAAIALTINVLSLSLVTFCLATTGILPIGVSLLLCVNLMIDLAELTKNLIARCREKKHCQRRHIRRINEAEILLDEALLNLETKEAGSYHQILKSMPAKDDSAEEKNDIILSKSDPQTKSSPTANVSDNFTLQLR